uniref:StAR-related lipid transfer (START) domain containing 5 n=1 Tax=Eptatretus burgeri TaxID=7764 RepID=A0A8C4NJ07_EPTBU
MNYRKLAEAVADKLLGYLRDEDGWIVAKKTDNVTIAWRSSTEFGGYLYKGEGVFPISAERLWEFVRPVENGLRTKWDHNVQTFSVLKNIEKDLTVCRTVTPSSMKGLISAREFIDLVIIRRYHDGTISSNAVHMDHSDYPVQPGMVRGFNHPCGCLVKPVPGQSNQSQLIVFFQTDIAGKVPRRLVDAVFPQTMLQFFGNLHEAVKTD